MLLRLVILLLLTQMFVWGETAKITRAEQKVIDFLGGKPPKVLRLWPKKSVHNKARTDEPEDAVEKGNTIKFEHTSHPSLLVYSPPKGIKRNGAAVVFCPGGGYNIMSMWPPSMMVKWMNHLGVSVAILKYHVPRSKNDPKHLVPLRDAQRAMSLLRSKAFEFAIDPNKIGLAGSSAGGHLAFNTTLNHENRAYEAIDSIDQVSCRPDFTFLFYPAYLSKTKREMLVSEGLNFEALDLKKTPPIFISIASNDGFITGNYAAMVKIKASKVPCEFHVSQTGGHGGMFEKYPMMEFARPGIRFLHRHGFVDAKSVKRSDAWLDVQKEERMLEYRLPSPTKIYEVGQLPVALDKSEYSLIEESIQQMTGGKSLKVYRLWPGEGTRLDDPFKSESETLKERKVPIGTDVTQPSMTFFPAAKPNGKAVLVFPGGGYGVLAYEHEGTKVAEWLNKIGISAFLIKYRTPRRQNLDKHHVALQDAQRAIRLVRSQANVFGVNPEMIGTLGFSAGGHLAALTGVDFEEPQYQAIDQHDEVSAKANFNVLIYPAYTTTEMFNDQLDPNFKRNKDSKTIPTFIATALDDKFTHGMFYFMNELSQVKTGIECHVYENGGHGKGINPNEFSFSQWPRECARWLDDLGNWR